MNVARHLRRLNYCNFQHVVFLPFSVLLDSERRNGGHEDLCGHHLPEIKPQEDLRRIKNTDGNFTRSSGHSKAPPGPRWEGSSSLGDGRKEEDLWTSPGNTTRKVGNPERKAICPSRQSRPQQPLGVPYLSGTWAFKDIPSGLFRHDSWLWAKMPTPTTILV